MRTSTERGSRSVVRLSDLSSSFQRDDDWTKEQFSSIRFERDDVATRRINGFHNNDDRRRRRRRLCVYVCARSATSIASFSVSICPFEIDDLSSDQAKGKTTANSRARLRPSLFTNFLV